MALMKNIIIAYEAMDEWEAFRLYKKMFLNHTFREFKNYVEKYYETCNN